MMGLLDSHGLICYIDRVSKKQFSFVVNGEILKTYKKRDSCNRQIEKLYNQKLNQI
jgi:hypothetical protein